MPTYFEGSLLSVSHKKSVANKSGNLKHYVDNGDHIIAPKISTKVSFLSAIPLAIAGVVPIVLCLRQKLYQQKKICCIAM
ncbi:MAG: hypothetical protein WBD31_24405 [Rubripirellula sp.]